MLRCQKCDKDLPLSAFNPNWLKRYERLPQGKRMKIRCSRCYYHFVDNVNEIADENMDLKEETKSLQKKISERDEVIQMLE